MSILTRVPAAGRRRGASGLPYLVMSGVLWGTGGLTGSLLGRAAHLPALSVAAYRLVVGGALMVAFLTATGRRWPSGLAAWRRISVVGLLSAVFQACYFAALSLTSVSLATLITIGAAPVIVLVAEHLTGRRRAGLLASGAAGLALAGLALLVGLPAGGYPERAVLASAGLALVAAAGFAVLTLVCARPVPGLADLPVTGFGFAVGGLVLMPVAAAAGRVAFTVGPASIGLLLALIIAPTAVAYSLYFRGLRVAAASTAALLTLLEPLTAAALAAMVLGQRLGPAQIAGAALLAAAVALTARAHRHDPRRSATGALATQDLEITPGG